MPALQLTAPHTHAGVSYPAGHVLDVDAHTARWLLDQGIAIALDPPAEPPPAAPAVPARPIKPHTKE
jgi:hypothetical protein